MREGSNRGKRSLPKGGGDVTLPARIVSRTARIALCAASALALSLPLATRAADPAPASGASGPVGFTVTANVGGGGQIGAGSAYQPASVFEAEASFAYETFLGLAPQLSFVLGMSPGTSFAIRPGLTWTIPETPVYLRAAFDASTQVGYMAWRWLLVGGGASLRITDVLGFMVELDSGFPLGNGIGVPLLVRAGAFARF